MKIVTGFEMQKIDKLAIHEFNIPSLLLMENAGKSVYEEIIKHFPDVKNKTIGIFCGKGNNGGDGFVTANYLLKDKINIKVFLLGKKNEVAGDAKVNLRKLIKEGVHIHEINTVADVEKLNEYTKDVDIVVDAILGTGFRGAALGLVGRVIDFINNMKKPIVSIDLPSGVNADTGEVLGACIKADITVTLGLPKTGLIFYPGIKYAGKIIVKEIGYPKEIFEKEKSTFELLESSFVKEKLPKRELNVHKGSVGKLLIIGGSRGYTGAVLLAAYSSLRTGVGLVTVGIPASLSSIIETKLVEAIKLPLPETKDNSISLSAEKNILNALANHDVLAIGPGLGRNKETWQLVRKIIDKTDKPTIVDADGLNAIAQDVEILSKIKSKRLKLILTPHPGEMARLINSTQDVVQTRRVDFAKEFAQKYNVILVLKGFHTVIASPLGLVSINPTGNPGMATAGMGDVLTGMISSLVAQGMDLYDAACCGVYLHGLAGDIAKEKYTEYGLIASDVIESIPLAIKKVFE
jgi:NAD(P)H-hydrate epimerase